MFVSATPTMYCNPFCKHWDLLSTVLEHKGLCFPFDMHARTCPSEWIHSLAMQNQWIPDVQISFSKAALCFTDYVGEQPRTQVLVFWQVHLCCYARLHTKPVIGISSPIVNRDHDCSYCRKRNFCSCHRTCHPHLHRHRQIRIPNHSTLRRKNYYST